MLREVHADESISGEMLRPFVGVHARIGGIENGYAGGLDPPRHSMNDTRIFFDCASSKSKNISKNIFQKVPIVVVSDAPAFKHKIKMLSDRVKFTNSTAQHDGRSGSKAISSTGDIDTFAELLILSSAACIVGSFSGFSGLAALISGHLQDDSKRCFSLYDDCPADNYDFFESDDRGKLEFSNKLVY